MLQKKKSDFHVLILKLEWLNEAVLVVVGKGWYSGMQVIKNEEFVENMAFYYRL